jgi:hypothetical protein
MNDQIIDTEILQKMIGKIPTLGFCTASIVLPSIFTLKMGQDDDK